jgi:hypothetical protein
MLKLCKLRSNRLNYFSSLRAENANCSLPMGVNNYHAGFITRLYALTVPMPLAKSQPTVAG